MNKSKEVRRSNGMALGGQWISDDGMHGCCISILFSPIATKYTETVNEVLEGFKQRYVLLAANSSNPFNVCCTVTEHTGSHPAEFCFRR